MNTRSLSLIATTILGGLASACATTTPPPLIEAREAYIASSNGIASKLTPTDLYDAKKALDKADQEFAEHGDTLECRDYAYIAHRKIELTEVKARTEQDRHSIAAAAKAGVVVRDSQVKATQVALAQTRTELNKERQDNTTANNALRATNNLQGQELQTTTAQLDAEKQARATAEAKLAGAMKDLAAVAAVKEEARGMVITLSGSVLFASSKYELLNTAMTRLDQVAEALKAQDSDKRMVVEGHTDNRGSDRTNQPLSLNRASAVRDYLVSRGVASEKITAVGMSSSKPIADNNSAENRANNRRVEIVVSAPTVSAR
ncbi:MAG TPA: OmpA family protein [Polyangia bacterium]|nr:OmpA family protein [Polyangia bacterium]